MEQINKQHFYSKQKERGLSMLVTSKEVYKVNRKRKKEYSAFDPSTEEIKDYKQKWHKPINYDSIKDKNKFWKEQDQDEFEKALEDVENEENSKFDDRMNVQWSQKKSGLSQKKSGLPQKKLGLSKQKSGLSKKIWTFLYKILYFKI